MLLLTETDAECWLRSGSEILNITHMHKCDHSDMLCLMHILLMLCCFVPVLVSKMLFTQHLYLHLHTELRNTSVRNKPKISILYLCSRPCEKYLYFCKCYLVSF